MFAVQMDKNFNEIPPTPNNYKKFVETIHKAAKRVSHVVSENTVTLRLTTKMNKLFRITMPSLGKTPLSEQNNHLPEEIIK